VTEAAFFDENNGMMGDVVLQDDTEKDTEGVIRLPIFPAPLETISSFDCRRARFTG
jgi:hypothetical protein